MSLPPQTHEAPKDVGQAFDQVTENLRGMEGVTVGNLFKACGPLLCYYFFRDLQLPEGAASETPPAPGLEQLRAEVDQGQLRQAVARAPFLMAEKPPEGENLPEELLRDLARKPKTPEEEAVIRDLMARGYFYDEGTGNYLDPRIFDPDELRGDPLKKYTFRNGTVCWFRASFGDPLKQLDDDMWNATGEGLIITSAFRSNLKQWEINNDSTVAIKAPVGHSQHEAGLAADIRNQDAVRRFIDQGRGGGQGYRGYREIAGDEVHFDTRPG